MEPPVDEILERSFSLKWTEYLVFAAVLVASMGIGVFYGFFGNANKTNEDFLMAGRSMSILPVTLSLVCSFVSAITLLGNPVEVYYYGSQYTLIALSFIPMTAALAYLYVPVYFELQLTSAYEYFEWRFSKRVRFILSVFAIIHLVFYMPTTVYGPSLALDNVAGINRFASSAAIFLVCIAYSSIGGLKAVLWTDALQAVVMVVSLICVVVLGVNKVGGLSVLWERAEATDRTEFFNFDPDPRTRHTFWTATVGGFLMWMPLFGATQAQIQRYNSVPTLRESRQCLLFNMFGLIIVICLCSIIGLMIYAEYYLCDPVLAKHVKAADQLLPMFVVDVLGEYTTIPGLLIAGLTCGSLSTVSSALNSLTAIITEDYVKAYRTDLTDTQLGRISKLISAGTGIIAFALVFVIAVVNESIQISPFSTLLHGALIGPILAAFTVGMFMPWANELGTLLGILVSIILTAFVGIGNIIASRIDGKLPDQKLFLTTIGCELKPTEYNNSTLLSTFSRESHDFFKVSQDWKDTEYSAAEQIWTTSYIWLPGIGGLTTLFFALLFSGILNLASYKKESRRVNASLLSKPFMTMWKKFFGAEYMETWVDYDSKPFGKGQIAASDKKDSVHSVYTLPRVALNAQSLERSKKFEVAENGDDELRKDLDQF